MGLESYLFYLKFSNEVEEPELDEIIRSIGFQLIKKEGKQLKDFRSYYYDFDSETCKTQAHSLFSMNEMTTDELSVRFSIVSPDSVIEQSFNLIQALNTRIPLRVFDTEIYNHIMRQLRRRGEVNDFFEPKSDGLEEEVRNQCYIKINAKEFRDNVLGIEKRKLLLDDSFKKSRIGGGKSTINYTEKKGITDKIFGWIRKEL